MKKAWNEEGKNNNNINLMRRFQSVYLKSTEAFGPNFRCSMHLCITILNTFILEKTILNQFQINHLKINLPFRHNFFFKIEFIKYFKKNWHHTT